MSDKVIDTAKLNEFMSAGWSWVGCGSSSGSGENKELIDTETGKKYTLYVENGKLSMSEVTE